LLATPLAEFYTAKKDLGSPAAMGYEATGAYKNLAEADRALEQVNANRPDQATEHQVKDVDKAIIEEITKISNRVSELTSSKYREALLDKVRLEIPEYIPSKISDYLETVSSDLLRYTRHETSIEYEDDLGR